MTINFYRLVAILALMYAISGCADKLPVECEGVNGVGNKIDKSKAVSDGDFVRFSYLSAFERPADNEGLLHHCKLLKDAKVDRASLIEAFVGSDEHRNLRGQ